VTKSWQISEQISCFYDFKKGGLTIITAAIFLAGEMAGSGVLALPYAILGTGRTIDQISFYLTVLFQ
jgi:amino acid permease